MCQGFNHFETLLHHLVLVMGVKMPQFFFNILNIQCVIFKAGYHAGLSQRERWVFKKARINLSNAEATSIQSIRMLRFLKII